MTNDERLLQAAAELASQCYERADEIEQARRLPPDISLELAHAGFYRMGVPKAVGGLESPPALSSKVFETLAKGDASAAWVAFIGATSGTVLSAIPENTARKVFSAPDILISGVYAPTGRAEKAKGGFRVSGKWQWGSGSQNAAWVLGGCVFYENGEPLLDQNGRPQTRMVLMPQSDVQFLDTWHVSGLCGTGSLDYHVEDLFVPEDQVVGLLKNDARVLSPLYAFPSFTFLALGIGAVCLGIARAAINELLAVAVSKKRVGSRKTVAEQQVSQIKLAQAEADLQSARLFYYDTLQEMWEFATIGRPFLVEQRRNLRLATTNAVMRSVGVVDEMYNLGGGSAVYSSSRLQRCFRDIHVAKTHIMVSQSTLETIGAHYFGLEPNISAL